MFGPPDDDDTRRCPGCGAEDFGYGGPQHRAGCPEKAAQQAAAARAAAEEAAMIAKYRKWKAPPRVGQLVKVNDLGVELNPPQSTLEMQAMQAPQTIKYVGAEAYPGAWFIQLNCPFAFILVSDFVDPVVSR